MAVASTRASVINQTLFNTSDAETGLIVRGVVLSIDEEYARTHTHTHTHTQRLAHLVHLF
jgi:hypothetical protein